MTFKILAVAFIIASAFFIWFGMRDAVFVSVVMGGVCFFISMRFEIKKRLADHGARRQDAGEDTQ